MQLILIRHAKADVRDARRYPDDAQRPLIKKGHEEQASLAGAMERMGVRFDYLATSPLVRAHETAEIIAREMKWSQPLEVTPVLGHEFSAKNVLKWLQKFPDDATIACVGHEPDLSELAAALLDMRSSLAIDFKKSGVMGIGFDGYPAPGAGTLLYFLRPKQILRLQR